MVMPNKRELVETPSGVFARVIGWAFPDVQTSAVSVVARREVEKWAGIVPRGQKSLKAT
jgi:hypothetical protein